LSEGSHDLEKGSPGETCVDKDQTAKAFEYTAVLNRKRLAPSNDIHNAHFLKAKGGLRKGVGRDRQLVELGQLVTQLIDLIPVRKKVVLKREHLQTLQKGAHLSQRSQITDLALC